MKKSNNKYELCGILNIPNLNILSVLELHDSVSSFFSGIDLFIQSAYIEAEKLRYRNVIMLEGQREALINELKSMFINIGCVELNFDLAQINKGINEFDNEDREIHIKNLLEKISVIVQMLKVCKSDNEDDEDDEDSTNDSLNYQIEKIMKDPIKKVLVVDDTPVILNTARSILKDKYKVYCLPKGEMVPKLLRENKIDLFILDIELPGIDGYGLFSQIRKMPLYKNTPIMFFTSHASLDYVQQAIDLGAADFIGKPIDANVFLQKVEKCLGAV